MKQTKKQTNKKAWNSCKSMYNVLHLFALKTPQVLFIVQSALVINAEAGIQ